MSKKCSYKFVLILASLMCSLTCLNDPAWAVLRGSAHDFKWQAWNFRFGQMCIVCHTPHNARNEANLVSVPLWNHNTTQAAFTLYQSPSGTLNAADLGEPSGVSKACLSCHDGTVGINAFAEVPRPPLYMQDENPSKWLGTDMSDDHPVSFTYNSALANADGELADPATTASDLGGTIQDDMLIDGKLECSSCHDVHNKYENRSLLVKTFKGSVLCLTCHKK